MNDGYIPIFQHGSSNCFEVSASGRWISEKNWSVLNYYSPGRYVFSADEIRGLAKQYSETGEFFKSRLRKFKENGEFERWFVGGMKNAKPLEFFVSLGNTLEITNYRFEDGELKTEFRYCPGTSEELASLIERYKGVELKVGFDRRKLILPKRNQVNRDKQVCPYYYAIRDIINSRYFAKLTRYGYKYTYFPCGSTRKFKREVEAKRYFRRYEDRLTLGGESWVIEKVNDECML